MKSFVDVIKALGGYVQVAHLLGLSPGTVSSMQSRDSISPLYWRAIALRAQELSIPEINVDALARIAAARRVADTVSAPLPADATEAAA